MVSYAEDAPWAHGNVVFSPAAISAIDADVVARYGTDEEACGYAMGPLGDPLLIDEVVVLENMATKLHKLDPKTYFRSARTFFAFNEKKFDDAVRKGKALERPVKVLYHSHLDTGAYFSATDASVMSFGEPPRVEGGQARLGPGPQWPLAFLVISVGKANEVVSVLDRKLHVWTGRAFQEAALHVREAT